jgi:hypothetical protein
MLDVFVCLFAWLLPHKRPLLSFSSSLSHLVLFSFIFQIKLTKTNTEARQHAENKHGSTLILCFTNADEAAASLLDKSGGPAKGATGKLLGNNKGGQTKKEAKKKNADNMLDMLDAGLATKKKK